MNTTPTPRTEERLSTISIENEDSCCAIYVKIDGKNSDCDLIDADFARQLERELAASRELCRQYKEIVKELSDLARVNDDDWDVKTMNPILTIALAKIELLNTLL